MVVSSSQAKLFDACHRLLPPASTSSSRPPPTSLSRSWPRQPPPWAWPWAWPWEDGEHRRRRRRRRGTSKEHALGLRARYCGRMQQQSPRAHQQQEDDGDQQQVLQEGSGIMCEPCNGRGWLLCDFCEGQKTNVKAENNRIYRRCPSCRAIGYVLCSNCKVFKCVTFPDYGDNGEMRL